MHFAHTQLLHAYERDLQTLALRLQKRLIQRFRNLSPTGDHIFSLLFNRTNDTTAHLNHYRLAQQSSQPHATSSINSTKAQSKNGATNSNVDTQPQQQPLPPPLHSPPPSSRSNATGGLFPFVRQPFPVQLLALAGMLLLLLNVGVLFFAYRCSAQKRRLSTQTTGRSPDRHAKSNESDTEKQLISDTHMPTSPSTLLTNDNPNSATGKLPIHFATNDLYTYHHKDQLSRIGSPYTNATLVNECGPTLQCDLTLGGNFQASPSSMKKANAATANYFYTEMPINEGILMSSTNRGGGGGGGGGMHRSVQFSDLTIRDDRQTELHTLNAPANANHLLQPHSLTSDSSLQTPTSLQLVCDCEFLNVIRTDQAASLLALLNQTSPSAQKPAMITNEVDTMSINPALHPAQTCGCPLQLTAPCAHRSLLLNGNLYTTATSHSSLSNDLQTAVDQLNSSMYGTLSHRPAE